MADQSIQVLASVRKALLSNSNITDIVGNKVYFTIPQQLDFPYILLTVQSTPDDRKTETSMDYLVRCQAFSRKLDQLEVLTLKSEIYSSLHRNEDNLNLSGLYQCLQKGVNITLKEPDGITWQSTVDYHLFVDG